MQKKKDSLCTIDPFSTHTVQHNYLDYMSEATKARGRDIKLNYFPWSDFVLQEFSAVPGC